MADIEAKTETIQHEEHGKLEAVPLADRIKQQHADLYAEALEKYGQDGSIDPVAEKKLKRKLDRRILPLLGIVRVPYCHDTRSATESLSVLLLLLHRQDHPELCGDLWP